MKIFYFIIVLILIVLGILVWINFTERKAETVFSSDGIEIWVLEAEVQGVLLRIVEPNGELSIFSDQTKKEALTELAERQKTLTSQADYFYHRLKRYMEKEFWCAVRISSSERNSWIPRKTVSCGEESTKEALETF